MLSFLRSALETAGADYLALHAERGTTKIISVDGEIRLLHCSICEGVGVRALVRGAWGRSAVTDLGG